MKKQATTAPKVQSDSSEASSEEEDESEDESGLTSQEEADYEMVKRDMPKSFVKPESSDDGEGEESEEEGSSADPSDVDLEDQSSEEAEGEDSNENSDESDESNNPKNAAKHKENQESIKNAESRLENYKNAIEYCKTHHLNSKGMDEMIKNKIKVDEVIKKMKKSKDAKSEAIYLPNEISPENLFGSPSVEINKEKADLVSLVNKSISDHQKLIQNLQNGNFKNKVDLAKKEKEIQASMDKQIEVKQKLEIIQTNRWWPIPEYSKSKASYFIPMENSQDPEGEKVVCSVLIKKQPNTKGHMTLSMSGKDGYNEVRKMLCSKTAAKEEFTIPLKNLDNLKDYI